MALSQLRSALGAYGISGMLRRLLRPLVGSGDVSRDFWSDYLNWLSFANAGMLARGNVWCMDYAIRNLPSDAPLLEIGSFCGLSANVIAYLKQRHGRANALITCDRWEFEGAADGPLGDSATVTHADYRAFVKDAFIRNTRMFSRADLPYAIEAFSDELFAAWHAQELREDVFGRQIRLGGPLAFCYIDGNHSYEFARRDFENCDRVLEAGGFILFDDSADGSGWEANRVAREAAASGGYQLVARNPNYLLRKR